MQKRKILDGQLLEITVARLTQEIIENHEGSQDTVILGLQPRGTILAERIRASVEKQTGQDVPLGYLDITFYRDDFRTRRNPLSANQTKVPFSLENKQVILVDDVLYTGRSTRAALDALLAFGRPKKVELLVLIDRKYVRDLPVEANYIGKQVNTIVSQHIDVQWVEDGASEDAIWLFESKETEQ
ncbi:MAG: bifunctional pyr operon transcriptional regulator/uracil phosphoribosyltransferase PyrR [Cytophagales bacterium]|nr:bifunctional pyr operon transcriptional regulator/uracil phosphoribosyltransferase PyrR [Cytophagales bacterium]